VRRPGSNSESGLTIVCHSFAIETDRALVTLSGRRWHRKWLQLVGANGEGDSREAAIADLREALIGG